MWDTALAVIALADAGLPADHPALLGAADWLLDREVRVAGDWAVRRPDLEPGGWSFEFANVNYPDVDDAAEVALALRRVAHPDPSAWRRPSAAGCAGPWGCRVRTGPGERSTPTTREPCPATSPSATSVRSSTHPAPT